MSIPSLDASIRTSKVDTAWAARIQSDRIQNPKNMVCHVWNGMDTSGRYVSPDSFHTKTAGCSSAEDRVLVENGQRPHYSQYMSLNASAYTKTVENYVPEKRVIRQFANTETKKPGHGSFGMQVRSNVSTTSPITHYARGLHQA